LDGPFPKLSPAVALSHQDGHNIVIESSFDPGERLHALSIVYKIFNIGKEPGWLNESGSWIT
jgi:hypothetical protein